MHGIFWMFDVHGILVDASHMEARRVASWGSWIRRKKSIRKIR